MHISKRNWAITCAIGYILIIITIIGMLLTYNGQYVSMAASNFELLGIVGSALWALGSFMYRQKLKKEKQDQQISSKA